jgi:hypothetical protein
MEVNPINALIPVPAADLLHRFQESTRVYVTGGRDEAHLNPRASIRR